MERLVMKLSFVLASLSIMLSVLIAYRAQASDFTDNGTAIVSEYTGSTPGTVGNLPTDLIEMKE